MGARGVHVTYKKSLPGVRAGSSSLKAASPHAAHVQLSVASYRWGCAIVLGGFALPAGLTRGGIVPARLSPNLGTRGICAPLLRLVAGGGALGGPISRSA